MKIIYLNCGRKNKDVKDHRSYVRSCKQLRKRKPEKTRAFREIEPITLRLPVQCSSN